MDTEALVESTHVARGELGTPIGEDLAGDAVETEDVGIVDVGHAFGGDCGVNGHEMALIRVVVHIDSDGVFAGLRVARQLGDEIDSNVFPGAVRYFVGL